MSTRTFAMIYGIVFVLVGIAGFIPAEPLHRPFPGDEPDRT